MNLSNLPKELRENILDMAMDSFAVSDASDMALPLVCSAWNQYTTRHFFSRMSIVLHTLAKGYEFEMHALELVDILLAYLAGNMDKIRRIPFPPRLNCEGGEFNAIIACPNYFGAFLFNEDYNDINVVALYVKNTRLMEKARACYGRRQMIVLGRNSDACIEGSQEEYFKYLEDVDQLLDFRDRFHNALTV